MTNIFEQVKTVFSADSTLRERAMISLLHSSMLNDADNSKYAVTIENYRRVGKDINMAASLDYWVVFKRYGRAQGHEIAHRAEYYLETKLYEQLELNKHALYNQAELVETGMHDIVKQFMGFLYLEKGYLFIYEIISFMFSNVIGINDFYNTDYVVLLNGFSNGKYEANIIGNKGDINNPIFVAEIKYNNKSAIGQGTSKKKAIRNAAEEYCKRNGITDQKEFKRESAEYSIYQPDFQRRKRIEEVARSIKIDYKSLIIALTQIAVENEKGVKSNKNYVAIGASIQRTYLHIYLEQCGFSKIDKTSIIGVLDSNSVINESIVNALGLNDCFISVNIREKGDNSFIADNSIKTITYFLERSGHGDVWKKIAYKAYTSYLSDKDIRRLVPNDKINIYQQYLGVCRAEYDYEMISDTTNRHNAIIRCRVVSPSYLNNIYSDGGSKQEAKNKVCALILDEMLPIIDLVFSGVESEINYAFAVDFLSHKPTKKFSKSVRNGTLNYNYWAIKEYKEGILFAFIERIQKIFNAVKNSSIANKIGILEAYIEEFYEDLFFPGEDLIVSYIVKASYEEVSKEDVIELAKLYSDTYFESKIKENPTFILRMNKPSEKYQMEAVKASPSLYVRLKNPSLKVTEYAMDNCSTMIFDNTDTDQLIEIFHNRFFTALKHSDDMFKHLLMPGCFDAYLCAILRLPEITEVCIAVGFTYSSGISLIEKDIVGLLSKGVPVRLLIGSLQDYNSAKIVKRMDQASAKMINNLIQKGLQIATIEHQFYHGKIYIVKMGDKAIVLLGSTNISKSAFRLNNELDYALCGDSTQLEVFINRFNNLWDNTAKFAKLDTDKFVKSVFQDDYENTNGVSTVSERSIRNEINKIDDELLKERLLLWLSHRPEEIYEDILVGNVRYLAFQFTAKGIIVLDSLISNNSYFVFYEKRIESVLRMIEGKSKTEVFNLSGMEKRGYHVRNQLTLKLNVDSYFIV